MTFFDALVLGIVEGVSEFLPISSTAHLMLAAHLLGIPQDAFTKTFEIAIQAGAILAVIVLYARRFLRDRAVNIRVALAFLPTALIGYALYVVVKEVFLAEVTIALFALLFGGIALILFEFFYKKQRAHIHDLAKMPLHAAFLIGCVQALAIVPGVSRAAATIVGGLSLGLSRAAIVEFSFLLAVPTMLAATGYDLMKNHSLFSFNDVALLAVGFCVAFIVAWVSIEFLIRFIRTHSFIAFGVYRIMLAGAWFLYAPS